MLPLRVLLLSSIILYKCWMQLGAEFSPIRAWVKGLEVGQEEPVKKKKEGHL